MRALALAIVLAGGGIEFAILRAANRNSDYEVTMGVAVGVILIAFIYCLVAGI